MEATAEEAVAVAAAGGKPRIAAVTADSRSGRFERYPSSRSISGSRSEDAEDTIVSHHARQAAVRLSMTARLHAILRPLHTKLGLTPPGWAAREQEGAPSWEEDAWGKEDASGGREAGGESDGVLDGYPGGELDGYPGCESCSAAISRSDVAISRSEAERVSSTSVVQQAVRMAHQHQHSLVQARHMLRVGGRLRAARDAAGGAAGALALAHPRPGWVWVGLGVGLGLGVRVGDPVMVPLAFRLGSLIRES